MIVSFADLVDGCDRLYELSKKIINDVVSFSRIRNEKKVIETIRDYIGEYDATITMLKANIEVANEKKDTEWFERNKQKIEKMFYALSESYWDTIMKSMDAAGKYFQAYPDLRDTLIIKFRFEGVDDMDPDPFPEEIRTLSSLNNWTNSVGARTRTALRMLNKHIEENF